MRLFVAICLFLFLGCDIPAPVESVDILTQDPAIYSRRVAIEDFSESNIVLPRDSFACNGYYVEEIFFLWYGIKAEVIAQSGKRDTLSLEMKRWQRGYNQTLDSLIFDRYGRDIYRKLERAADSLEKREPMRYPAANQSIILPPRFSPESLTVTIWRDDAYPFAETHDSIIARSTVGVDYDSTGKTKIGWIDSDVRRIADLTRMEVLKQLPNVEPVFRWGNYQSGEISVPVVYRLKKR